MFSNSEMPICVQLLAICCGSACPALGCFIMMMPLNLAHSSATSSIDMPLGRHSSGNSSTPLADARIIQSYIVIKRLVYRCWSITLLTNECISPSMNGYALNT